MAGIAARSADAELEARLLHLAQGTSWFRRALRAVEGLGLDSWCIAAGAVRNLLWDSLHGYSKNTPLSDLDVVYFDPSDGPVERELQRRLHALCPSLPWEVTNQARGHKWSRDDEGRCFPAYRGLEEAIGSWPEYATCVGIGMAPGGTLSVVAPHGLADLFAMVLRHNPVRASAAVFRRRLQEKQFCRRWPRVRIVT